MFYIDPEVWLAEIWNQLQIYIVGHVPIWTPAMDQLSH